jgi:dTDP-4-dehydrorhamnose reductase
VDSFSKKCEPGIYNLTNVGSITTRQVVEWMKEEGVADKDFQFFKNEKDFMSNAAITPRSNCVMDTKKSEMAGIALRPVEEAVRDSLSKMRMQVSV